MARNRLDDPVYTGGRLLSICIRKTQTEDHWDVESRATNVGVKSEKHRGGKKQTREFQKFQFPPQNSKGSWAEIDGMWFNG